MRDEWDDAGGPYDDLAPAGAGDEAGAGDTAEPTIVIEDEALRHGFTQLPNYLFQVRGLSHSAKLTYALILSYAWQKNYCFPGQKILARDLEVSTRSVIEYLKELQGRGLIRIQRRGLGKTNIYHVLRYPPAPAPAPHNPVPVPPTPPSTPPSLPEVKVSSHQGVKRVTFQEVRPTSHPEVRAGALQEVQPGAGNKNAPPAKNTPRHDKRQQKGAAALAQGLVGRAKGTDASQAGLFPVSPAFSAVTGPADRPLSPSTPHDGPAGMARAALQAHGVRNERLLAELTADPGEVFAQIERLQHEVERGAVANPAGWLVEAIRGRYRLPDGDEIPSTPDRAAAVPGDPAGPPDGLTAPAAGSPEGGAWARVCAELRGEITPENYGRWFAPAVAESYAGTRLTVGVPDAFHQQWLDRRLRGAIERAAARALGDVTIAFVVAGRA